MKKKAQEKTVELAVTVVLTLVLTYILGAISQVFTLPAFFVLLVMALVFLVVMRSLLGQSKTLPLLGHQIGVNPTRNNHIMILFWILICSAGAFYLAGVLPGAVLSGNSNFTANVLTSTSVLLFSYSMLGDLYRRMLLLIGGIILVGAFLIYGGWIPVPVQTNTPSQTPTPRVSNIATATPDAPTIMPSETSSATPVETATGPMHTLTVGDATTPTVSVTAGLPSSLPSTTSVAISTPTDTPFPTMLSTPTNGAQDSATSIPNTPDVVQTPSPAQATTTIAQVNTLPGFSARAYVNFTQFMLHSYDGVVDLGTVTIDPKASPASGQPRSMPVQPDNVIPGTRSGGIYRLTTDYNFSIQSYQGIAVEAIPRFEQDDVFGGVKRWGAIQKLYNRETNWGVGSHRVNSVTNEENIPCPMQRPQDYNGCFELEFTIDIVDEPWNRGP